MLNHKQILDHQKQHWNKILKIEPDKFGMSPSHSAIRALKLFQKENIANIIELGGGQGRDTIFFAQNNIHITTLDYSQSGINATADKAQELNLTDFITAKVFDARQPLPFKDETFEACYSHMLFSSALTISELRSLSSEIHRILLPGGINFFTARNTTDPYFQTGIHRTEYLYEIDGYIMHFLSKENIDYLKEDYKLVEINEIEEGQLPKRLFEVVVRKP
jgi:ubiquinone/menaquinone biosynthesis C-methylase UbiE